jgi:uncharacterized membrane protein YfcA
MVLAAAAAFTGASLQSATGFGFALVLSPALFAVLEPVEAVSTLLVLGLVLNLLVLLDGGSIQWRALAPLLAAALPGLAVGLALLTLLPKATLQVAVGGAVLAAVAVVWRAERRTPAEVPRGRRLPLACATGLATGALTTSVSVSGPPLVLWLRARGLGAADLRASLAASFLALNLAGAGLLVAARGTSQAIEPALLAPLAALVVVGHFAGARAFRRLDPRRYSKLVLALVAAAGLASVAAGL